MITDDNELTQFVKIKFVNVNHRTGPMFTKNASSETGYKTYDNYLFKYAWSYMLMTATNPQKLYATSFCDKRHADFNHIQK